MATKVANLEKVRQEVGDIDCRVMTLGMWTLVAQAFLRDLDVLIGEYFGEDLCDAERRQR